MQTTKPSRTATGGKTKKWPWQLQLRNSCAQADSHKQLTSKTLSKSQGSLIPSLWRILRERTRQMTTHICKEKTMNDRKPRFEAFNWNYSRNSSHKRPVLQKSVSSVDLFWSTFWQKTRFIVHVRCFNPELLSCENVRSLSLTFQGTSFLMTDWIAYFWPIWCRL